MTNENNGGILLKKERREWLMRDKKNIRMASLAKNMLDKVLVKEANSTSCGVFFQGKEPKGIERFKKER